MGTLHLAVNMLAFLKVYTFQKSKVGTLHQERNLFSQEHHAFFEQPASSMLAMINYLSRLVKIPLQLFGRLSC